MRIASLLIIAFSIVAIAGGFLSGNAAVPSIVLRMPSPNPIASTEPVDVRSIRGLEIPQTDEVAYDDFAGDAAVVPDAASGDIAQDAQLSVVLVGCGHSPPLEAPFLALGIPMALIIDPDGPAAVQMAQLAQQNAKPFFIQTQRVPDDAQVQTWQRTLPGSSGVAIRLQKVPSAQTLRALRVANLALLDEFGESTGARESIERAGVKYVRRTITIDDHLQPSYVQFMLDQAVHLGRGGHTVIMARPLPGTLRALQALIAQADRDGVRFGSTV